MYTSVAGVRGDRRSTTLGLLSLGVLLFGDENESGSDPGVLSFRAVRGVVGDGFGGTSREPGLLHSKHKQHHQNTQLSPLLYFDFDKTKIKILEHLTFVQNQMARRTKFHYKTCKMKRQHNVAVRVIKQPTQLSNRLKAYNNETIKNESIT